MKKLLNTLFITTEDAYLTEENDSVVIRRKEEKLGQFPLRILEGIVLFSYTGASPALLGKCSELGISVTMYTPYGRFLCRVGGKSHGNVLLRKEQYRISDSQEKSLPFVRNMICGKIYNERWVVGRALRDHALRIDTEKANTVCERLKQKIYDVKNANNIDTVRGMEGDASAEYFSVFDSLILNQKEDFFFAGRNRRPPKDNVNAMLSFCYTLLANECADALETVGLDAYVGFMHTDKPGRKSMALDLMEELRAPFADRFVLTQINQRQVNKGDFIKEESGAVHFTDVAKKNILKSWQEYRKREITHPYLQEKIEWGLVPYVQALLLSRVIRGDITEYPPFFWK